MSIAKELRKRRGAANLSMRQLAIRSGLATETISKIERGRVPNVGIKTLTAISNALGVKITDLLRAA